MGKLIIIEAGDGSGKATQTNLLYENLKKMNKKVAKITFPNYNSPASMPVKMYLNGDFGKAIDDVNPYAASVLFAVDRFASFKEDWEKYLLDDYIVLADRYTTSNMVHQGVKLNEESLDTYLDWLFDLEFSKMNLPKPDKVFFLDVNPEITTKLINTRSKIENRKKDIHEENEEYLTNCYNLYKKLSQKYNWEIIDCTENGKLKTKEKIAEMILKSVMDMLKS